MKPIHIYFYNKDTFNLENVLKYHGDYVINKPISATFKPTRNGIWYLELEVTKESVGGKEIPEESLIKVDLNYASNQLFGILYVQENKKKGTYKIYANHVFFDCQKEVIVFDNRTIKGTWEGAISTLNEKLIQRSGSNYPYKVYGNSVDGSETRTAYWERKNIIDCMFGTEDNSMVNRWTECDANSYTAMLDNYDCYFGDGNQYAEHLKPNTYRFNMDKIAIENSLKVSVENIVTGIVPKAYNGRLLPNSEIVKLEDYDTRRIHRIEFIEYSDLKFVDDVSDESEKSSAYQTLDALYSALRAHAKRDLRSKKYRYSKKERDIKIADLFGYDEGNYENTKKIKLNDVIELYDPIDGSLVTFKLQELEYDLITENVKSIKILDEGE